MTGMKSNNAISPRSVFVLLRGPAHFLFLTDIHDKGPKKERMALAA